MTILTDYAYSIRNLIEAGTHIPEPPVVMTLGGQEVTLPPKTNLVRTTDGQFRYNLSTDMRESWGRAPMEGTQEQVWGFVYCDGPYDRSPVHLGGRDYDSDCGWCYLGAGHTWAEHTRKVKSG